jgi:UDP-N-acetyl-2-amino-2-deoxyglucuronate dehydrogenase
VKTVRVGVIGTGWGEMHIDAFKRVKGAELVAVCDLSKSRSAEVAKNAKIPNYFTETGEMLANTAIDLVSVASPPDTHKELVLQALAAGKHVLCETPLGLNRHEAASLLEAAEARGVFHGIAVQTRYLPGYAYAKELIDEEYLGTFLRASLNMTMARPWGASGNWAADEVRGGGVISDVAIHFIDALRWWFGPVEAVMADRATLFPEIKVAVKAGNETQFEKWSATADDAFTALLRFQRGGLAVLNFVSGTRQDAGWTIALYGSRGSLQITSGSLGGMRDGDREWGMLEIPRRFELPDRPREPLMWALARLSEGIVRQVRGEKLDNPPPTFRDGLENLKIVDAIKRSADDMLWAAV